MLLQTQKLRAVMLNVLSMLEQINTALDTCYAAIYMAN